MKKHQREKTQQEEFEPVKRTARKAVKQQAIVNEPKEEKKRRAACNDTTSGKRNTDRQEVAGE